MPVVVGAARSGPPPPAPSIYKKATCFPSCDQRRRAAYPLNLVSFFGVNPSALTVQSCFWSFSPAVEKNASVLESGDHAGSASVLSPIIARLTIVAGEFSDTSRTYVCLDAVAAVVCPPTPVFPPAQKHTTPQN